MLALTCGQAFGANRSPIEFKLRVGQACYDLLWMQEVEELQLHVHRKDELVPKQCPLLWSVQTARDLLCFGYDSVLKVGARHLKCLDYQRSLLPELPCILLYRHSFEPSRNSLFTAHQQGYCASTLASDWASARPRSSAFTISSLCAKPVKA